MNEIITSAFFHPDVGDFQSRIVMSAMTRGFALENHVITSRAAEYYSARAKFGAGIILTEGIIVHQSGDGYNNVPHMSNLEHAMAWQNVVKSVHAYGAKIYAQLWHCGRVSHTQFTGGSAPISSTDVRLTGINRQNGQEYSVPKKADSDDIASIISYFTEASRLCKLAGFHGVQLHYGHGYLLDQFLNANVNILDSPYGGTMHNRCRLALEIFKNVAHFYEPNKIQVRLSPIWKPGGVLSQWPDWENQLKYLLEQLYSYGCRIIDISAGNSVFFECPYQVILFVRTFWKGLIIGGASLSSSEACFLVENNVVDFVSWGRLFIANPDLASRLKHGELLFPFESKLLKQLY